MTAIDPSSAQVKHFADGQGRGAIIYDARLAEILTPASFDARSWGAAATPVSEGGRGAAWFIEAEKSSWVLRHYRRGGLAAKLSRDRYLWAGEAAVRSVAEFYLLQRLHGMGLPVPKPVAAFYSKRAGLYRAAILIERIKEVRPLAAFLNGELDEHTWRNVGATLARFHNAGVDHADLNANNILLANKGAIYVIDFDRGSIRHSEGAWRENNLARLQRSLEKIGGRDEAAPWRKGWAMARAAYASNKATL